MNEQELTERFAREMARKDEENRILREALMRGHTDDDGVICSQEGRAHRYPCASCVALGVKAGG